MPLIAESTGTCVHSGTTLQGDVHGTLEINNQDFVFIEDSLMMSEGDLMVVPTHWFANLPPFPPLFHFHKYPATSEQVFVYIEDKLINCIDDEYALDKTVIDYAGIKNSFVFIEEDLIPPIPPTELWPAPWDTPSYPPWLYYW